MKRKNPLKGHGHARERKASEELAKIKVAPNVPKITYRHGKRYVNVSHIRDLKEDGCVVAQLKVTAGEYIFPEMYVYKRGNVRFIGMTVDAQYIEGIGWKICVADAVLRGENGEPVLIDGNEIDLSGWYLESALEAVDPDTRVVCFKLGATVPKKPSTHHLNIRDAIPRSAWCGAGDLTDRESASGRGVPPASVSTHDDWGR